MYIRVSNPKFLELGDSGRPAAGYLVYTLVAGTVDTLVATYSDKDLTSLNTNPIVLDANGEADIFTDTAIKLVYTSPTGDLSSPIWTEDYVGEMQANYAVGEATPVTLNNNYVVDTVPAVLSLSNNFMLTMTPDVDNTDTIASNVFTGTGPNDLTAEGPYVGASPAVFTFQIDGTGSGLDVNTSLLLRGDGAGAVFVDSSVSGYAVTAVGDVTQSATYSKFGGKSIYFDGTGDYLTVVDSDDWYFDGDFTVDFWIRFSSIDTGAHNYPFFTQSVGGGYPLQGLILFGGALTWMSYVNAGTPRLNYWVPWTPVINTWYHIAIVRNGNVWNTYINGIAGAKTLAAGAYANAMQNIAAVLEVGGGTIYGDALHGYMDEFRVSKGLARWTSDFAVPDSVDTFKWKKDGGAWTTAVPITGESQVIYEGLEISFSTLIGHVFDDVWAVTTNSPATVNLDSLGSLLVYKNKGGTVTPIDGDDMQAGYPSQLIINQSLNGWMLINPATPVYGPDTIQALRYRKNLVGDYTISLTDQGKELSCNGTLTVSLLSPPEFVNRFIYIVNAGSESVTVDAGAGYVIQSCGDTVGSRYLSLGPYFTGVQLQSNGVDWHIITSVNRTGGSFTCANAAETTVLCPSVTGTSLIFLMPTNAAAGLLQGAASCLYVLSIIAGTSFTVKTANAGAAGGTETFNYFLLH
jgi:hypothetical protein